MDESKPIEIEAETETKMMGDDYYGPVSFAELMAQAKAQEAAAQVQYMAALFPEMVQRIMARPDITDKEAALDNLSQEFVTLSQDALTKKEKWQPLTNAAKALISTVKDALADKEELEDKAIWSQAFVNNLPDSSFLWIAPGGTKEDGKTVPRSLRYFPYKDASGAIDLPHLRNAIARIPQAKHDSLTPEKKASLQKRAQALLASANKESFTIWHDKEKNQWRWFAIYSNKFRDDDNPPEIISDNSHREFIKSVESGLTSYPELWLWHVPGSRVGQSDWLAYTDEGFALASGYFENEQVAKALSVYPGGLRTSHGMPSSSIKRDSTDKSIIIQHITKEISPLPPIVAANKLTEFINFELKEEGEDMAIPEMKKEFLKQAGLTDEQISQIETGVKEKAAQADAEQLEYKEALTADGIVKAIETYFAPLATRLEAIEQSIKALQETDAAKIADKAVNTPKLSLEALAQSRVDGLFSKSNQISGVSSLARSGPKQAKVKEGEGLFFQNWMQPVASEAGND